PVWRQTRPRRRERRGGFRQRADPVLVFVTMTSRALLAPAALAAAVLLAACPSGPSGAGGPDGARGGSAGTAGQGKGRAEGPPPRKKRRPITFAPCSERPCMLHAGRGRYHECLNPTGGRCSHFGAPCAPAGGCMRDPASSTYRTCEKVRGGECD